MTPRAPAGRAIVLVRPSVRWRLLLAFLGISSFTVLGGGVAIYSFLEMESALKQITARTVPTVLTSLRLSRRAERLVAAAPALLAATTPEEHAKHAARIESDITQLGSILKDLKLRAIDPGEIRVIEAAVDWLTLNLISLETTVGNGLVVREGRRALVREALAVTATMSRLVQPSLDRLDDRIASAGTVARVRKTERPMLAWISWTQSRFPGRWCGSSPKSRSLETDWGRPLPWTIRRRWLRSGDSCSLRLPVAK
jgi:adenylate cyclase